MPHGYFEGVLIMELVTDAAGISARLGESVFPPRQRVNITASIRQVVHASPDSSTATFPVQRAGRARRSVIIDLPQAVCGGQQRRRCSNAT